MRVLLTPRVNHFLSVFINIVFPLCHDKNVATPKARNQKTNILIPHKSIVSNYLQFVLY